MGQNKVYWAGDLFDLKDLIGNRLLADAFDRAAEGRWTAVLPQDHDSNTVRSDSIRDDDLEDLFSADALVANFDGTDLDSGTVAEFCFAKFLDLPVVLLRTDFRNNNDPATCPDPWNLMCSGYPRCEVLLHPVISASRDFATVTADLGRRIVLALDRCAAKPPVTDTPETAFAVFRHAVLAVGGTMRERFPDDRIRAVVARRFGVVPGRQTIPDERSLS